MFANPIKLIFLALMQGRRGHEDSNDPHVPSFLVRGLQRMMLTSCTIGIDGEDKTTSPTSVMGGGIGENGNKSNGIEGKGGDGGDGTRRCEGDR